MEYTQEQIDAMLADAKKGLFTEEELTRKVTSEVDRRVETGIQKGLETNRKKWEEEYGAKAKMTAEELAKKEFDEKMKEITSKEVEIKKKANLLEAKELLASAEIPKSKYEKMIPVLVSDNEEVTKANIESFINLYKETVTEVETNVKKLFTNVPPPNAGNGDKPVTKDIFDKMSYGEKMTFKGTSPEMYKKFME